MRVLSLHSRQKLRAKATSQDRGKEAWDLSFRRSDEGGRLTERDLIEMHGAGLGLMWTTHTTDLHSALAVLHRVEMGGSSVPSGPNHRHDQARRVLEDRVTGSAHR
jgi:hypothetical protein